MEFLVNLATDTTEDNQAWKTRYQTMDKVATWFERIVDVLLLLCSSITFYIVIYKRKIRNKFAVVLLTSYILASIINLTYRLIDEQSLAVMVCFGQFFGLVAHWTFPSKYLETSYVLPNVLVVTDLDFMHKRASSNNDTQSDSLDTSEIRF